MARSRRSSLLAASALFLLLGLLERAQGFAVGPGPQQQQQQQRPQPTSPYERRDRAPATAADEEAAAATSSPEAAAPFVLGPGSRVAVAGVDSGGALGRLVTKKLFQSQLRPYLLVPNLERPPSGLGLDQYKVCVMPASSSMDQRAQHRQRQRVACLGISKRPIKSHTTPHNRA
jgi:hypothetical protein